MPVITVDFIGVAFLGGGRKRVSLELEGETSIRELFELLEKQLDIDELEEKVDKWCMVLLDGTGIEHLQKKDTRVGHGAVVSVVPLLGGG